MQMLTDEDKKSSGNHETLEEHNDGVYQSLSAREQSLLNWAIKHSDPGIEFLMQ